MADDFDTTGPLGRLARKFGGKPQTIIPVVRLNGTIGTGIRELSLATTAKLLSQAFGTKGAKAVAIALNSPGGSPVQSRLIHLRIRALAEQTGLPVWVFVEDVAASGGYMIACAGDQIFCDPSSIVGSIGVIGGSFGFAELIKKIGVERRIYTSGTRKSTLDPFLPEKPEDVSRLKSIQREIHDVFIDLVRTRRGSRLNPGDSDLFNGEYWTGQTAVRLGLADGLSDDLHATLRKKFGEISTPVIANKSGLLTSLLGRRQGAAASLVDGAASDMISAFEQRARWAQFGL